MSAQTDLAQRIAALVQCGMSTAEAERTAREELAARDVVIVDDEGKTHEMPAGASIEDVWGTPKS